MTLRKKHGSNSAPTRSGTSEAEASSSEIALKCSFANVNGVQTFEDKDSENLDLQINNRSPKPCESLTKLKIICNQEKEDGNKSYMVLSNSKDDLLLEKPQHSKKRKRDDNDECNKSKEVVERKYEVRTRGISLTKNYSFEKKSHKKIFIIPPTPPVDRVSLLPKAAEEPTVTQNTKNAFLVNVVVLKMKYTIMNLCVIMLFNCFIDVSLSSIIVFILFISILEYEVI